MCCSPGDGGQIFSPCMCQISFKLCIGCTRTTASGKQYNFPDKRMRTVRPKTMHSADRRVEHCWANNVTPLDVF